ncbi:MAG: formylglycine-generating enzyme family protein, partial [Gammaproteobacteria bacterium]
EFSVKEVVQCMRWIPPGRFMMGSPEDEPMHVDWEAPVHSVELKDGFWLFDTPVTQKLYEAVMEENPSIFVSPDRPVEEVSHKQAGQFIERLNAVVPGLGLMLPSESQWEYACRAGSTTALYSGSIEILGERNAPALDAIAWYGGNSGKGYELDRGVDSSDWSEKQYDHSTAGTMPVKRKRPNAWGLHDMLGNVWEWTADHWHESYEGAPEDGSAWLSEDEDARRVVRGGSWYDKPHFVRSSFRHHDAPVDHYVTLGFRCARAERSAASQW